MMLVEETTAGDVAVVELTRRLREELRQRYGEDVTDAAPDAASPAIMVLSEREVVGCVVLALQDHGRAQLRSMFVVPAARGLGLSRVLLDAVEEVAARRRVRSLSLVTGVRQPEAMALYERSGFSAVACEDDDDPETRCYEKAIVAV